MIISHHKEKLISLITFFLTNTKKCGKTKLFKLLYFADFKCFKETGKSMTGMDYFTWKNGPVPTALFAEMKNPDKEFHRHFSITPFTQSDLLNIKPLKGVAFDPKHFTKRELQIIKDIAYIFDDAIAKDIVEVTHMKNDPWDKTLKTKGENKKIDYTLALDSDVGSLSLEEYKQRKEEEDEIKKLLS